MRMSDAPCNPSFLAQKGNCNNESIMRMIAQNPSRLLAGSCLVAGLHELGGLNNTVSSSQLPYYQLLDHNQGGHDEMEDEVNDDPISCHVEKKRRLTSEQVKSLEMTFDFESKLEPERKNQLAQELGLQPRQVAIWFQNRRARSKTKQLERDYDILKDKYDVVVAENGRLQEEITKLNQLLKKECIFKEENDATSQVTVNGHEEVDAHTEKETDRQINLHADDAMSTQNPRPCSVNEREERGEDVWQTNNLKERQNCPPPPLVEAQHAGRSALERLYNSLYMQHQAAVKVEDGYCTQEDLYGNALFTQEDHPPMMLNLDWS